MEVTDVKVKLNLHSQDRLRAFCSVTFDNMFVVKDIRIIDGPNGLFVAMPSRKIMAGCHNCGFKNALTARYCNECGAPLAGPPPQIEGARRIKFTSDVAHPINASARTKVQQSILSAFAEEAERARQPGYNPRGNNWDDLDDSTPEPAPESTV